MELDKTRFIQLIDSAPLVSIDLILQNKSGEVLLGQRRNRPAKGYWFVPGGRIRKNEALHQALSRIAQKELGVAVTQAKLLGIFDHFYEDNYFNVNGLNTHYVAVGLMCEIAEFEKLHFDDQHTEFKWWTVEELLQSNQVHQYTKQYFQSMGEHGFLCSLY